MPARRSPRHVLPATDGAKRIGMQLSSSGYPHFRLKVRLCSMLVAGEINLKIFKKRDSTYSVIRSSLVS
jgi:hypothetical protein